MSEPLNWHDLEIFHAVLEHGSFSAAARTLHMSQPTVSRHIDALERKLGRELFVRAAAGLQPSELALRLRDAAAEMNEGMFTVRRLLDGAQSAPRGVVTLSIPFGIGNIIVAKALEGFHERFPDISIDLKLGPSQTNLGRREADIDLRWQEASEPDVISRALGSFETGLFASESYLRKYGVPRSAEELENHGFPWLDEAIMERFLPQLEQLGVRPRHFPFRCSSNFMVMMQLANLGLTLGYSPFGFLPPAMTRLLPAVRAVSPPLWLTMHSALRRNAPIRAAWDWLVERMPPVMQMTRESNL
jgi:DNA-binding transcriptional LysR family regulator